MKQRSERTFDGSVLVPTCTHKVKIQRSAQSAQSAQSDQEVLHVRAWTPAISFRLKSANCPEKLVELELVARLQDATNMAEVPTNTWHLQPASCSWDISYSTWMPKRNADWVCRCVQNRPGCRLSFKAPSQETRTKYQTWDLPGTKESTEAECTQWIFAGIIGSTSQHWTSKQVATSTVHIWPYCVPHISVEKFAPPERKVRLPVVNISHFSEGSVQCHLKMDPAEKALMTSFGHGVFANFKVRKLVWFRPSANENLDTFTKNTYIL